MNPPDNPQSKNGPSTSSTKTGCQINCDECQWVDASRKVEGIAYCAHCNAFLCGPCLHNHRRSFASKDHRILEGRNMPESKFIPRVSTRPGQECANWCKKHPGNLLEYYCKDHGQLLCKPCITLDHTTCNNKYSVDSYSSGAKAERRMSQFQETLTKLRDKMKGEEATFAEYIAYMNVVSEKTSTEIDEFHKRLGLEAMKLKKRTTLLRDNGVATLKRLNRGQLSMLQTVERLCQEVDNLRKLNKKSALFSMMLLERGRVNSLTDLGVNNMALANDVKPYCFHANFKTLKCVSSLGDLRPTLDATNGAGFETTQTSDSVTLINLVETDSNDDKNQQLGQYSVTNPKTIVLKEGGDIEEGHTYVIRDRQGNARIVTMSGCVFQPVKREANDPVPPDVTGATKRGRVETEDVDRSCSVFTKL